MSSVLLTGASRGIGRAIAVELSERGHRVVATARDAETLADLDVAGRLALDVADQAGVDAAVAAAGEVDVFLSGAAYAASKWALEALVESLAVEVGHFGVGAALLEPGGVSSGALDDVLTYRLPGDPYGPLLAQTATDPATFVTPELVAAAVADAIEVDPLPLRIPVGATAERVLAARKAAPDDTPFGPPLDW